MYAKTISPSLAAAFAMFAAGCMLGFPLLAQGRGGNLEDDVISEIDQELKNENTEGGLTLLLVGPDGKGIDDKRFVRQLPGQCSVSEFPHVFKIEGKPLFTAGTMLDASLGKDAAVRLFTQADPDAGDTVHFRAVSTANIQPGRYTITPFGLDFEVTATKVIARHPALSVTGETLAIHVVPVSFRAIDEKKGYSLPLPGLAVQCGSANLLADLLPAGTAPAAGFCPLTLYLPRGVAYTSNVGNFSIDADGKITPVQPEGFKDGAFVVSVSPQTAAVAAIGRGYWLFSHNLRQVFKRGEMARFGVIASGQYPETALSFELTTGNETRAIGVIRFPAVDGTDARLLLLDTAQLPPGKHVLRPKHADGREFAFELVELLPETPIALQTVGCCNGADFGMDAGSFEEMHKAGIQTWITYGHGSLLGSKPYPSASLTVPVDAPPELRAQIPGYRLLLEDTLRHGLTMIDYENRRAGFYNEGLSYHHSYGPSVERLVRRVQIFMQEVEDYPACIGLTYTWFPCLGGYVEGGVPCDPYFGPRMQALHAKVKEKTSFVPLTAEENQLLQKGDPAKKRELADKYRNFWRAEQRFGWQDSFGLYNQKLREVRADYVSTTSENTGHDMGKSVADMGARHDAMSYECYTDYGDWPNSSGWLVDWVHANLPEKPVWFTVDGTQTDPAICAKGMYAFARGAEGIGIPLLSPAGARSNRVRGLFIDFAKRYGPLVTDFSRESQVAILGNEIQFPQYHTHVLHSDLMRLGYAPVLLSERTIEKTGVPTFLKAIFIPNLKLPFSAECEKGLKAFMAAGGKVVSIGEDTYPLENAVVVNTPLKQLWDIGGFAAHLEFWQEFHKVRPVLEKTLADLGLQPPCGAAPEKALIIPLRAGGVRYVAVIASAADTRDTVFTPVTGVKVNTGAARKVMNLVTGEEVPLAGGSVTLDLTGEPFAFLALLDTVPESVNLNHPATATAGDTLEFSSRVSLAGQTGTLRLPVEYVLTDPAGKERARFYRFADRDTASYRLADLDAAGDYTLTVKELLTGLTAQARIPVAAAKEANAVTSTAEVYLPHPDRVTLFLQRQGEVRVLLEEAQADLLPEAERVVTALNQAGRKASLQRVGAASFDTLWLRWFPGTREEKVLARIDSGEIVGFRGNLDAYINKATRQFVPEKGGWTDIAPLYIVRSDAVLFSGGRLADSLRQVTDWMNTPNLPGKGTGIVEVALSPFWADRHVAALVANDAAGRKKTVDAFLAAIQKQGRTETAPLAAAATTAKAAATTKGNTPGALDRSLKGLVPPARCLAATSSEDGFVAVEKEDGTALVSPKGELLTILPRGKLPAKVVAGGRCFWGDWLVTRKDPSWNFPTAWKVTVNSFDSQGKEYRKIELPEEVAASLGSGWEQGFAGAADGKMYFAGRMGGGFILFDLEKLQYRVVNEQGEQIRYYEQVREPVVVTSAVFSPNGDYVFYTAGNHPSSYGPMHMPSINPFCVSMRLVNSRTGETVWRQDARRMNESDRIALNNCATVTNDGKTVAYINYYYDAILCDAAGKEVFRQPLLDFKSVFGPSLNVPPPSRVEMSTDATTLLFAGAGRVLVTDMKGGNPMTLTIPVFSDVRLARDGSRVYAADADGFVVCYDRVGKKQWALQTHGASPRLAAAPGGNLWVAEGAGNLLLIDPVGKVTATVNLTGKAPADIQYRQEQTTGPAMYRAPRTLEVLEKRAGAKLVARYDAKGTAREIYGLRFFPTAEVLQLAGTGKGHHLVHLVYRHTGKATKVTIGNGGLSQEFVLDLPTPEYRVVDLPFDANGDFTVTVPPNPGLEVAELAVYSYSPPGANAAYIRPPNTEMDNNTAGLDATGKPAKPDTALDVLDDTDNAAVAKAASGRMKDAAIFSINPDVDKVAGAYLRETSDPMLTFDGFRFDQGKGFPPPWISPRGKPAFGTKIMLDLGRISKPSLCLTYARTFTQSAVMKGLAVCAGNKADMAEPSTICYEPRVVSGAYGDDQFFHAFDMRGTAMEVLGVFAFAGGEEGLSEVELYE